MSRRSSSSESEPRTEVTERAGEALLSRAMCRLWRGLEAVEAEANAELEVLAEVVHHAAAEHGRSIGSGGLEHFDRAGVGVDAHEISRLRTAASGGICRKAGVALADGSPDCQEGEESHKLIVRDLEAFGRIFTRLKYERGWSSGR